jgi:hypothetical protein
MNVPAAQAILTIITVKKKQEEQEAQQNDGQCDNDHGGANGAHYSRIAYRGDSCWRG